MNRNRKSRTPIRKSLHYRGTTCLNCGSGLKKTFVYCPNCSQLNSNKQLSAKDFVYEFFGMILFYDPRMRYTFRDLLFRPGVITKNYVKGQRLKYANPFRFFLSVSIIYFIIQGLVGSMDSPTEKDPLVLDLGNTDTLVTDSAVSGQMPSGFIPDFRGDTVMADRLGIASYYSENAIDTFPFFEGYLKRASLYMQYQYARPDESVGTALRNLNHMNNFKNRFAYKRMIAVHKIIDNPRAFISFVSSKIPFFLFFFTPIFAIFFWAIYSRKKYNYMEHIIFIFHIFSFVFLGMLIVSIPDLFVDAGFLMAILFLLIAPFYFYKALRNFYNQNRAITLLKFLFLSIVFNIGFFFTTMVFVAASAIFY